MRTLVRMEGVSKFYPRVHRPGERLKAFVALMAGRRPQDGAEVLHDINLEVCAGQSFGIIGENGAGKSTLLKVLAGVIKPSKGHVEVNARVAALLELGAGFQPQFSGIENIKMKASLLGMSTKQLDKRMDDILAFADIGEYVYEPVKHYSSGMVVRLGFAVVAASEPELLITDEVLAVGDESFQKKCIRWIESFLENGNTLLMVSHSMYLVQKLCTRALWVHQGRARQIGDVFPVTQAYLTYHEEKNALEKQQRSLAGGDEGLYSVKKLTLSGYSGDEAPVFPYGEDLEVELILSTPDGRAPVALIGVKRADGTPIYGVASDQDGITPEPIGERLFRFRICFNSLQLLPGSYNILGHAMDPEGMRLCDIREQRFIISGQSREMGFIHLPHNWNGGD